MIAGANKNDYHLRNVTPGEDFKPSSPTCGRWPRAIRARACGGPLKFDKTIEIGHIFKLGYKYSESMGLRVLNANGRGSHADHGLLRHRHRAHSERRRSSCITIRTA